MDCHQQTPPKDDISSRHPRLSEARPWWEKQWQQLHRWSRYLELWFPDYAPDGVFFSSSLLAEGAQRDYGHVMSQANTWLALFDVLTEHVTSDEWIDDSLIASIEYAQTRREADDLGIDQSELNPASPHRRAHGPSCSPYPTVDA